MKTHKLCLSDFIIEDPRLGLIISGANVKKPIHEPIRKLNYYSVDKNTNKIIANNLRWSKTGINKLLMQFIYLMLPTPCNNNCAGCFMGQDKKSLPPALNGPYFSDTELDMILEVAKNHGAKAVVYGGGGELFMWKKAFPFIERIIDHGLGFVTFTNGTLLTPNDITRLNALGVVLIISLRDTVEAKHNICVGRKNFRRTIQTIETCLELGMNDGRLAVEIPATIDNEGRILNDLLPVCRALDIVPWFEEFILISASQKEKADCHSFRQTRRFFQRLAEKDAELGVIWQPEYGQRMIDQPQCRRALYSFAVFPNGDVFDCVSSGHRPYGNLRQLPLEKILQSKKFRQGLQDFSYCPCSRFFTENNKQIPLTLPPYLED